MWLLEPLKAAGSTPAEHQEELRKDISHQPDNTHDGGRDRQSVHHHQQQDLQSLHVEGDADHDDDNINIKSIADDEDSKITVAQGSQMEREKGHLGNPQGEHSHKPKDSTTRMSASARRTMFARRHYDASTLLPSRGSRSPCAESMAPRRETSPPASPSPSHSPAPTSSISPSGCHVSSEPQRPASPVMVQSLGLGSSGPRGSLADVPAECQTCFHLRDRPTTARLPMEDNHISSNASRPRGSHVLSHLPLHSQQPSRALSLLIPIGGIHMIQPRSTLPLYNLRSSSTAARCHLSAPSSH
ncbi:transcription factor HIVEP2-like [Gouania willdenowi]|uniref:transcription factor HIVEP2-like n=1 Tax=Gouania willdenowi TaxID=441366 RepID=UPI001056A644|nr:transcription factor HIVEP2-like [Gouania willdenowi]